MRQLTDHPEERQSIVLFFCFDGRWRSLITLIGIVTIMMSIKLFGMPMAILAF